MSTASSGGKIPAPHNDASFADVWEELSWRGLIHVSTDPVALKALLSGPPVTYYCGFDPTAPSLHLGNLVQLLVMRRLQLAGHRPLALVGGSTGLIGDPKPTAERTLNDPDTVALWVEKLRHQVTRFLDDSGDNAVVMVNNLDWTKDLSAISFLRDIGQYFRVGTMIKKDAVAARLNSDAGISYTEFSYQILQGMDFMRLHEDYGCMLQTGGSDQWGNLTSGTDLVHKALGKTVHALGTPLITNSDGTKFGKSEGNAVWLDRELTSPWAMYQFWLNTDDRDVIDRLKVFTFLSRDEIESLEQAVASEPHRREAQRTLALHVTALVHGEEEARAVEDAALKLFGKDSLDGIDAAVFDQAMQELPLADVEPDTPVTQALVDSGLCSSVSEARRAISQGGVSINNTPVSEQDAPVGGPTPPSARWLLLKRGKKTLAGLRITA
ncbi:tyrosyl-tRNA synthetase [Pontimonas salivibrio]|uniref:Tyrosine--tRNA ligase n=1 Tax=Pontimonas salivibrio TaxID=1159327 RepID=A0A2L2BR57_9MICO|nr:tyrosine--tRNA ligase [Pontimonas salivibrio]AVG24145.1 tyrosyl-tRNA synthetase [Pontimonas salivibrio]